jgi:hypothetical protein
LAISLGGCAFTTDVLWPTLTGEDPKSETRPPPQRVQIAPSQGERAGQPVVRAGAPPQLGTTKFVPPGVTPGQATGTFVGEKVVMLRGELQRMQGGIGQHNKRLQQIRADTGQHSQAYHGALAAINTRLQVGTTPGNPFLIRQWNEAQSYLAQVDGDVANMNTLANDVAGSSTMSAYLLETTRAAYGLTGAVEEDHRQLAILEDEVNRTVVLIDRLLNELSEDINRQSTYLGNQRHDLTTLSLAIKNGELLGTSLASRTFGAAPIAGGRVDRSGISAIRGQRRRPLVVIRFDRPNVAFEEALYTAVSRALERRPQAAFDLVAVAPGRGSPAQVTVASNKSKRNAESVLRSLSNMGLPLERVRLSAMTSTQADTNEVHIYVR